MHRQHSSMVWLALLGAYSACGSGAPTGGSGAPSSAGNSAITSPAQLATNSAGTGARAAAGASSSLPSGALPPQTNTRPSQPSAAGTNAGVAMAPPMAAQAGAAAPGNSMPGNMPPAASSGNTAPPPADGPWPAADPAKMGPYPTTMEEMVGPGMAYTMFRPKDLNRRHPVITWGNGTGTTPPVYRAMLDLYASHGFIVIASNSENVAQGNPPPMLDGVTWVLEQDMTMGSSLFGHVDRDHIGATGHSQGAFAASSAGTDARIKSIAPIETLGALGGLHGPALGICGTMDTTVPCSGNMRSFMSIADQPVMYAEFKAADHTNWIFSPSGPHPYYVITNAWFRVHLMGDTALRPLFYGADCTYCKDDAWVIMRKMMD